MKSINFKQTGTSESHVVELLGTKEEEAKKYKLKHKEK